MNQSCRSPPALCLPLQVTPVRRTAVAPAQSPRSTAPHAATSRTATAPQPPSRPKPSAPRPPRTERRSARSPVTSSSAGRRAKDSDSWSSAHWTVLRRPPPTVSPSCSIIGQIRRRRIASEEVNISFMFVNTKLFSVCCPLWSGSRRSTEDDSGQLFLSLFLSDV